MSRKTIYPNRKLGRAFKRHRETLSLSIRETARKAGVDHTTIMRLEQGREIEGSSLLRVTNSISFVIPTEQPAAT